MTDLKTVALEIVRRGPPHNQLLSPTTDYLALCGSHPSETLHLPFEHWEFLHRLRGLRYVSDSPGRRRHDLQAVADDMRKILRQVPGLIAELGPASLGTTGCTHMRLILSSSELALLPFELALGPSGFPAAGQHVTLQVTGPIAVTREIRRMSTNFVRWPDKPKVLLASAGNIGSAGSVPLEHHMRAISEALEPWQPATDSAEEAAELRTEFLTVLPRASIASIAEACRTDAYTHVHLLAHGAKVQGDATAAFGSYGVVLFNSDGSGADVVSGTRLASALRGHRTNGNDMLSCPAVVTVASCDNGTVDDVVTPGASLLHSIHETGIPFVVGSQFPLSKAGSVLLTRVLYGRLLWGHDPRVIMHDVRTQLHQTDERYHDWASIVAYANFPPDFDEQLRRVRSWQGRSAVRTIIEKSDPQRGSVQPTWPATMASQDLDYAGAALASLGAAIEAIPQREQHEAGLAISAVSSVVEEYGIRGAGEKRRAHHELLQVRRCEELLKNSLAEESQNLERKSVRHEELYWAALGNAHDHYRAAFKVDMSNSWAATQYLSLCIALKQPTEREHWQIARATAFLQTKSTDAGWRAYGHSDLMELSILSLERDPGESGVDPKDARLAFWEHWDAFWTSVGLRSKIAFSMLRQLWRYGDVLPLRSSDAIELVREARASYLEILPEVEASEEKEPEFALGKYSLPRLKSKSITPQKQSADSTRRTEKPDAKKKAQRGAEEGELPAEPQE